MLLLYLVLCATATSRRHTKPRASTQPRQLATWRLLLLVFREKLKILGSGSDRTRSLGLPKPLWVGYRSSGLYMFWLLSYWRILSIMRTSCKSFSSRDGTTVLSRLPGQKVCEPCLLRTPAN